MKQYRFSFTQEFASDAEAAAYLEALIAYTGQKVPVKMFPNILSKDSEESLAREFSRAVEYGMLAYQMSRSKAESLVNIELANIRRNMADIGLEHDQYSNMVPENMINEKECRYYVVVMHHPTKTFMVRGRV